MSTKTTAILRVIHDRPPQTLVTLVDHAADLNVNDALRAAVRDWLSTDDGKQYLFETGEFNWGDALLMVPDEKWSEWGLIFVGAYDVLTLDHDENLDASDV